MARTVLSMMLAGAFTAVWLAIDQPFIGTRTQTATCKRVAIVQASLLGERNHMTQHDWEVKYQSRWDETAAVARELGCN